MIECLAIGIHGMHKERRLEVLLHVIDDRQLYYSNSLPPVQYGTAQLGNFNQADPGEIRAYYYMYCIVHMR